MCHQYSESGQPCGFSPCVAYKRLEEENAALRLERDIFLDIAKQIAVIFVYGDFVAETPAERKLEKTMREAGIWWESVEEYESQWLVGDRHAK